MEVLTIRSRFRIVGVYLWLAGWAFAPAAGAADDVVTAQTVIRAPLAKVWHAWTTTEGVTGFGIRGARIELRVGGPYEWHMAPGAPEGSRGGEGCTVLSFLPMKMLAVNWNAPPVMAELRASGPRTQVVVLLDELGPKEVRVTVHHLGFGEGSNWDTMRRYFHDAWPHVLERMKGHLEEGEGAGDAAAAPAEQTKHWVYYLHPARPGFLDAPTEAESGAASAHAAYIKKLTDEGVVILAGPSFDPPAYPEGPQALPLEMPAPGIVVFKAVDIDAARRIMNGDPAVQAGVFKARLNQFKLSFSRP